MKADLFSREAYFYHLPEELIAQHPLKDREQARLLVVRRDTQTITHDIFQNVGRYLPQHSSLVINNTKVIAARLFGTKEPTGAKVEIFVLKELDNQLCEVLMRPMKRLHNGDRIIIDNSQVVAEIIDKDKRLVKFSCKNILAFLAKNGHIPLPPYVKREDKKEDRKEYQTVYAKHFGSVAAPTAGLHFTKKLMAGLKKEGHQFLDVTLHINYGTFKPVEENDIRQHPIHEEYYEVGSNVKQKIDALKKKSLPIVAVGTTSCRTLETMALTKKNSGNTNLFIYPGCKFNAVDSLITNFHLPYSTLLMLVSAFGGYDLIRRAYEEAIKEKYRFYSYGDAMIII